MERTQRRRKNRSEGTDRMKKAQEKGLPELKKHFKMTKEFWELDKEDKHFYYFKRIKN